jgi:hypothetical protein
MKKREKRVYETRVPSRLYVRSGCHIRRQGEHTCTCHVAMVPNPGIRPITTGAKDLPDYEIGTAMPDGSHAA